MNNQNRNRSSRINIYEKRIQDSIVTLTEIVLPNDANPLGSLLGGRLLYWMDLTAAICAQSYSCNICVTAGIERVAFLKPAKIGDIVTIKAVVVKLFNTSMRIKVQVVKKALRSKINENINDAIFTFVSIDEKGNPVRIERS